MSKAWRTRVSPLHVTLGSTSVPDLPLTLSDFAHVYEPSEDTYLFLDVLGCSDFKILFADVTHALEIGSGSGVLSTALMQSLNARHLFVSAVDVNAKACEATERTWKRHGLRGRADVGNGDLVDWFRDAVFDLVLFNPPYVPTPREEMRDKSTAAWAGGLRGREVVDRLFLGLNRVMRAKSAVLLLAVEDNDPDELVEVLEKEMGYTCYCAASRKAANERLLVILALRGY